MYNIALGIVIGFIFICLIVIYCVLLGKLYIRKIKTYTQQLYQKDIEFQKILTTTVMETYEQAANNISSDLHDDIGQQLTVINLQLENLKYDSEELQKILDPVSESFNALSHSIRGISHSLNNQLVIQQDLLKAISSEIERLRKRIGISVQFHHDAKAKKEFTANEKIIIYRIFQECINNILKHSKATAIKVEIKAGPRFAIQITDNGIGFSASEKDNKTSLGLFSMNERAAYINYELNISSSAGEGTTITLTENKLI